MRMKPEILILGLLLSGCGAAESDRADASAELNLDPAQAPPATSKTATSVSKDHLEQIVSAVMQEQYGDRFNAEHSCWETSAPNDGRVLSYCMKPGPAEVVETASGSQIYLRAANVADISGPGYEYGQIDPGQMGAFNLRIENDGSWAYLAAEKAMTFGTVGYCGCDAAKLVKLRNDGLHGWMFISGGVWQGIAVTRHSIVAPQDETFKDTSSIPETPEDEQNVKYGIDVIGSADGDGMFPLLVTRNESGKAPETFIVNFDNASSTYSLPQGK